jgi:hypothetical protein
MNPQAKDCRYTGKVTIVRQREQRGLLAYCPVESRTGAVTVVSRVVNRLGFRPFTSVRFGLVLFPVRRVPASYETRTVPPPCLHRSP